MNKSFLDAVLMYCKIIELCSSLANSPKTDVIRTYLR